MRAREFTESLDASYPLEWEGQLAAYFRNANDDIVHVGFGEFAEGAIWYVSFDIQHNHDLTGRGDEFRTMASVAEAIRTFVARNNPRFLMFTSAKADTSRSPLYRRMTKRLLAGTDYVDISNDASGVRDDYVRGKLQTMMRKFEAVDTFVMARKDELGDALNEVNLAKNVWELLLTGSEKTEAGPELVDLVKNAYSNTPMGSFVQSIKDVMPSDWLVLDHDDNPDIDVLVFYRSARAGESWVGHKIQGIGHDGTKESKSRAIAKLEQLLSQNGWWMESSDAMRHVLRKRNMKPVTDVGFLRRLFRDPGLRMIDHDTYTRQLQDGTSIQETVFGRPKLK